MDKFAEIGRMKVASREKLVEVTPNEINEKFVELFDSNLNATKTFLKASSKTELDELLRLEREKYKPFLCDYSPKMQSYRAKINLKDFTVDGEKITIPHYEGPVGNYLKTYKSEFIVESVKQNKAYYICFKGVDYIAEVFLNGVFVGRHEGFFAPFEFNVTPSVNVGKNILTVKVYNDYIYGGNSKYQDVSHEGDKLYAATGIGWDGAYDGWHHCPPGMGIYNDVYFEERNEVYISDIFVRPLFFESKVEAWIDAFNTCYDYKDLSFKVSIYGKNFNSEVYNKVEYVTKTDENFYLVTKNQNSAYDLKAQQGVNTYKISLPINDFKAWNIETPYLYKLQVEVSFNGVVLDSYEKSFGMRSFIQDTESEKKGAFYLNGKKIKLRGANTMGFEQLDVLRGDFDRLIDDILLAKICNMNFLRITQRPVQDEIYAYADALGLMIQTDLPLFGVMRRTKFAEGIRQAEEMEKLVRSHPSVALVSLINEPFPNAHNRPHRHLLRNDLSNFFISCEHIIKLNNPDRVIKYVDGDYDPPSDNMPDNHCYNLWYNGHCLDVGKLIKGYWCNVKPNWYYGSGEFGIEGLDFEEIIKNYYPSEWITEPFDPYKIVGAQTGSFYRYFYPRAKTLSEWVEKSQRHQAESVKIMTEAFRRNNDMVTFAVHLFIDAWPSGWMKTIMDFKRNPKPSYFEYRNALEPIHLSLRTDKLTYFVGEEIKIESYICNDTNLEENYSVIYELLDSNEKVIKRAESSAKTKDFVSEYLETVKFKINAVKDREKFTLKAILLKNGEVITYNNQEIEVFENIEIINPSSDTVWVKLDTGTHFIAGEEVVVKDMENGAHFTEIVEDYGRLKCFKPYDFKYWYDKKVDRITPLVTKTIKCKGFMPILLSANHEPTDLWTDWKTEYAVAEKYYQGKRYIIYTLDLRLENPICARFVSAMNK